METSEFLLKVYGTLHGGYLSVTTLEKDGKARTKWFDFGQLDEMAAYAVESGKTYNTYFGVNPRVKNLGEHLRGSNKDIAAVIGTYTDFDIKGDAHKEKNLPETKEELMMTILAGYAEAESRSASENMKWRIKKKFEEGSPWDGTILGYRYQNGAYVIRPEEAEIVRRIYREYLSGKGVVAIMNGLNADGIKTRYGNEWHQHTVGGILRNSTYTGNLLLQKTYRENHLTKRTLKNNGELPKYSATGTHEAIISAKEFDAVQAEIERRAGKYAPKDKVYTNRYPFSGLIVCDNCGKHYRRKVTRSGVVWICSTFNIKGKTSCPSKQIPEETLIAVTEEVIGNIETIHDKITAIRAKNDNRLVFCLADGRETVKRWQDRSRAESWTDDMKASAREKTLKRQSKTKLDSST